jgi:hypothetical protein
MLWKLGQNRNRDGAFDRTFGAMLLNAFNLMQSFCGEIACAAMRTRDNGNVLYNK